MFALRINEGKIHEVIWDLCKEGGVSTPLTTGIHHHFPTEHALPRHHHGHNIWSWKTPHSLKNQKPVFLYDGALKDKIKKRSGGNPRQQTEPMTKITTKNVKKILLPTTHSPPHPQQLPTQKQKHPNSVLKNSRAAIGKKLWIGRFFSTFIISRFETYF